MQNDRNSRPIFGLAPLAGRVLGLMWMFAACSALSPVDEPVDENVVVAPSPQKPQDKKRRSKKPPATQPQPEPAPAGPSCCELKSEVTQTPTITADLDKATCEERGGWMIAGALCEKTCCKLENGDGPERYRYSLITRGGCVGNTYLDLSAEIVNMKYCR